jgi:hypothetical protein
VLFFCYGKREHDFMSAIQRTSFEDKLAREAESERKLRFFSYGHLPEPLQNISLSFAQLAVEVCERCQPGPERTVALRKLLEAKDAAVRARLHPGG